MRFPVTAAALLAAGCAAPGRESPAGDGAAAAGPALVAAGPAQDCISQRHVLSTRVLSDRAILFRMRAGPDYRSDLRSPCPGLRGRDTISYRVATGSICSIDTFDVVDLVAGINYGACPFGPFTPVEPAPAAG